MKKTIAMLLTAALSASLLSGCVTKVSDETAASSAETEAAASDSASAEETAQAAGEDAGEVPVKLTASPQLGPLTLQMAPIPLASDSLRSTAPWTTAGRASFRVWQRKVLSKEKI